MLRSFQFPLALRAAAPDAGAGAGGVDEHEVELRAQRFERLLVATLEDLDVANAGAFDALEDGLQAVAIVVVGEDLAGVLHLRRERQRLAAGSCTQIQHLKARAGSSEKGGKLGAFVLDFAPAGLKSGFGFEVGRARSADRGRHTDAQG